MKYVGEVASLLASVGWAGSAIFFEFGSRRIGSRFVNLWRLLWAFLLLLLVNLVFHRSFLRDVGLVDVGLLLFSGFVGFFLGDILLFWSFVVIGSRLSLLIMLVNPLVSTVGAFFLFG
ncbi:MAG: EamA family transporter, partial [Brevinematales bacterium]